MTRDEARARFSDYLENALDPAARDEMQAFLAQEPEAAAEMIGLERTLSRLHRLPPREPVLDLWLEFAPQVEAFRAEHDNTPASALERLALTGQCGSDSLDTGVSAPRSH